MHIPPSLLLKSKMTTHKSLEDTTLFSLEETHRPLKFQSSNLCMRALGMSSSC